MSVDLEKLVRTLLVDTGCMPQLRLVRAVGDPGWQVVDLRADDLVIRIQRETGTYDVLFESALASEWFLWSEVMDAFGVAHEPLRLNDIELSLKTLCKFLATHGASIAEAFSAENYPLLRSQLWAARARRNAKILKGAQ